MTEENDAVLVLTPGYPYYQNALVTLKRRVISSQMKFNARTGKFEINWNDFENKLSKCRLLILSHPHNPSGQIWTFSEL